ncbi:GDSL-type esterase/lipase family protein [Kineococcus sp. DHX-1]|uniref:GDSL-type esterase/lipase family protein n=1 Tax=Kineococcus sp. DHX-1 TaxID=3349638 RepID=UPI0036D35AD0
MTTPAPDVRVCFVGDSFVAGAGDPEHLGWVGRVAAAGHADGRPLTSYDLGVRRGTSGDVLARWRTECTPRLPTDCRAGVVVSFGVNGTTLEEGRPRTAPERCAAHLEALLRQSREPGWPVLVVGPPAVDDEAQNDRTAVVDAAFTDVCSRLGVPYVGVLPALRAHALWRAEVRAGDGAHPGAAGHATLAALVLPTWRTWSAALGSGAGANS